MKNLITAAIIILTATAGTLQAQTTQCKAITQTGKQCSRKATINGYCKQHYNISTQPEEHKRPARPKIDLPEEWQGISTDQTKPALMIAYRDPATNTIHFSFKH